MPEEFGIDELARRAGTTVRNVRLYVERGLLPRARKEGRAAYYSAAHLTRLQIVLRLVGRGYPLAAIRELTEAWDDKRGLGHVLGLEDALAQPFATEEPGRVTLEELAERFPSDDPATIDRAVALGLIVPDGDDFVVPSPAFLDVGAELVAGGVPVETTLDMAAAVREHTDALADAFVDMFLTHVWAPFEAAGEPADQQDAVAAAIQQQRPLATKVVAAALAQAMQAAVDRAIMMDAAVDEAAASEG